MKKQVNLSSGSGALRQRAEKILGKNSTGKDLQLSDFETLKLIHELEVHQIELELQKDELQMAKEHEAELAAGKYVELYVFAPTGYFTLSKKGIILELNLSGSQLLGRERSFLINTSFDYFVSNDSRSIFRQFLGNLFESRSKLTCEIILSPDAIYPPASIHLTGQGMENREQCFISATDITLRKQAEDALKQLNEELDERVKERTSELLKLNSALVQAEEKYKTVADFTWDWEYWMNPQGGYSYVSPACERISGHKAEEFIQNPGLINEIIHPDDLKTFQSWQLKETSEEKCFHKNQFRIFHTNGSIRWIENMRQAIYDQSGYFIGIRGSIRDITVRKKMEQLIKTNSRKYALLSENYALLSENITDGMFIFRNSRFVYVNNAFNHLFGFEGKDLIGLKLKQLVLPEYLHELDFISTLKVSQNQIRNLELECSRKDGAVIFVEFLFNYVAKEGVIFGVAHDITEKREFQKNMVKAIILTEEKERTHFSKELHDGLGPLLSTIKLYLQWSERSKSDEVRDEIIHKAEDILEEALKAVKEISNKLSPHLLTNYGLRSATQSFINKLEEASVFRIEFNCNLSRRLSEEIETVIYRAIIECINNTIKHSGAENVTISMIDTGNELQVHYTDNGIGYDLAEMRAVKKGLGLFNLQNRIQNIGGMISMSSSPGQGVNYHIAVKI